MFINEKVIHYPGTTHNVLTIHTIDHILSPLHHRQTLFPPGEAAAAPQTEAALGAANGRRGLTPLHYVLQGYRGGPHR